MSYNSYDEDETEERDSVVVIESEETRSSRSAAPSSLMSSGHQSGRKKGGKKKRGKSTACPASFKEERIRHRSGSMSSDSLQEDQEARSRKERRKGRQEDPPPPSSLPSQEGAPQGESDVDMDDPGTGSRISADVLGATREILQNAQDEVARLVGREDCPSVAMDWKEGGQGRKPVSCEFYLKRMLEAKKELIRAAQELKNARETVPPAELSNGRTTVELRAKEELSHQPTEALPAIILEAVGNVDFVAQKSKNIKEGYIGKLNESAATIKVAVSEFVQRQDGRGSAMEGEAELKRLRIKVSAQERELEALRNLQAQYAQLQKDR